MHTHQIILMSDVPNSLQIKCHAGTQTVYAITNSFRPFCSERCKMIDLGQWADENYKIPIAETSSTSLNSDESENKMNSQADLLREEFTFWVDEIFFLSFDVKVKDVWFI